jgi:hypothetical protein
VIRRASVAGTRACRPARPRHRDLVVDAQPFEVTTLREDTETFGRKAKVAPAATDPRCSGAHYQRPRLAPTASCMITSAV